MPSKAPSPGKNRRGSPSAALHEARNGVSHSIASCALHMDYLCGFYLHGAVISSAWNGAAIPCASGALHMDYLCGFYLHGAVISSAWNGAAIPSHQTIPFHQAKTT